MTEGHEFVDETLRRHAQWVTEARPEWSAHWSAYDDDFWRNRGGDQVVAVDGAGVSVRDPVTPDSGLHLTETNLVRPYVTSHMSSLYYEGTHVEVTSDELAQPGERDDARARKAAGVEALINRWLASASTAAVVERVLEMSLMYKGGAAYKVCLDPARGSKDDPLSAVFLEAVPPWEGVWDRRTRSEGGLRFMGHLRQEPLEVVRAMAGGAIDPDDLKELMGLADVVEHGFATVTSPFEDRSYLWVLTLDNLTEAAEVVGEEGVHHIPGKRTEYLVDGAGSATRRVLREGPVPYADPQGRPVPDLVPFIAEPVPHRPWDSIAPMATTYTLNAELNGAQSVLAGQFRRDASRRVLTTDDDEDSREKLAKASDGEVVPVKPPSEGMGLLRDRYHVLDLGPISQSMTAYVSLLRDGLERSQTMSDLSRGKGGQYMRAETARALVDYDAATIGRIRKRSDDALSRVCTLFLQVLSEAMKRLKVKSIRVVIDVPKPDGTTATDTFDVQREHLDRRWKIQVVDSATTPDTREAKLQQFVASLPSLMEMAAAGDPPDPTTGRPSPTQQAFAIQAFDYMATQLDLPPALRFSMLKATAPAAPPAPPAPPVEPAPLPVEEAPVPVAAPPPAPVAPGAPPGGLLDQIATAAEAGM